MNIKVVKEFRSTNHFGFGIFSWWRTSFCTRGVAVAVSAINGTFGYLVLKDDSFL